MRKIQYGQAKGLVLFWEDHNKIEESQKVYLTLQALAFCHWQWMITCLYGHISIKGSKPKNC